jgi:hypothetical protein
MSSSNLSMSIMSVTIMSMSMFLKRKNWLDIFMREDVLDSKSIFLEEFIFIKRSEEFVLLDVRISSIGFLRVNSGEVLSLKHVLKLEAEVAEETREVEVPGGGFILIVMFEDPESVNSVEDVISRVSFVNSLHLVSVEVVPKVVSNND